MELCSDDEDGLNLENYSEVGTNSGYDGEVEMIVCDAALLIEKILPIDSTLFPNLSKLGKSITDLQSSSIIKEVISFGSHHKIDLSFQYTNGRKGLLILIRHLYTPHYHHFRDFTKKTSWIYNMIKHINSDDGVGAQLLSKWLCSNRE